jgi:hypothetical protein
MTTPPDTGLSAFRGAFPEGRRHARTVADSLATPGCTRRRVIDGAGADINVLAELLGCPPANQSRFALTRGNAFEKIVTDNGMAYVIALVREKLDFDIGQVRQLDLSAAAVMTAHGRCDNELRVKLTANALRTWWNDDPDSPNLLRHAMTRLDVGGETVYLEQDVLAFRIGDSATVVEIKSFPAVDGVADPDKVAASALQSAVYVVSIQDTLVGLGADPGRVSLDSLLILPLNFSLTPTAHLVHLGSAVARLRRQLASLPRVEALLDGGAVTVSLPAFDPKAPTETNAEKRARKAAADQAADALSALPPRFGDECVSCPLFRFCRDNERAAGTVAVLGSMAANACGEISTVGTALALAEGRRRPRSAAETAVATTLGRAHSVAARYGIGA